MLQPLPDFKQEKTVTFYADVGDHKPSIATGYPVPAPPPPPRIVGAKVYPSAAEDPHHRRGMTSTTKTPWWKRTLDPGSEHVLKWNHAFHFSCLVALFVDPLYFYLPSTRADEASCIKMDWDLGIGVTAVRCVADVFYVAHMLVKFRTAYVAPSSRVFGRGELVEDRRLIARRYLRSDFLIDLAAALPLPQNLSSYGQNLETSTYMGETSFAILIAIIGLILFAHLIGNMQTYLQSMTVRLEEWRLKRRDTEEWMRHRQLPHDLQKRVRQFVQYKWLATRGVDEETILRALPTDLRRDIQRHLCLDLVRRVPLFSQMDDQLLDAICERLVSSLSTQGTYIVREGDPVTEMLFIIRGKLESSTTNGGRTGFFNSITLLPGDFCGEELLAWALLPKSSPNLPSSTRTVRTLVEVEAFALCAEDLKFVANQFRRLHSKKLQHTFRFYSHHWRTWAACFIQAAWRRFKRRTAKSLSMQESFSSMQLNERETDDGSRDDPDLSNSSQVNKQNLGVTILASKFTASTRRGTQKKMDMDMLKLQKPEEPDFSNEVDDDV
ncbi:putative cyclic nucleotide-gated ion channel 17 [Acorus calamus]|uniref:Cyclic nucleotide-gated ion channel 17 n=1 Tax=Acorus calamus TaxID=4465 RepID=A0AAV9FDG3_ACOCL|nr:putative cyclic nucleotide-gated ion channel 17 [Acorus calamus]